MIALALGQTITFWVCAVIAIAGAVGVIASTRPVYSALSLAVVMIALAALYASLQAEFLFAVQIIVYTGAVLMLFLFVIMMVGVSTRDHLVETLKGHRAAALVAGLALIALLGLATGNALTGEPAGLDAATADGYIQSLSQLIFQRYVIAFEATAALLITAAVAAMVLAHPKRLRPKPDQTERLKARLLAYAERGEHPGALPNSGVMARHNSIATPALLPDGTIAETSVSQTVAGRVAIAAPETLRAPMATAVKAIDGGPPLIPPEPDDDNEAVILNEVKDLSGDPTDDGTPGSPESPPPPPPDEPEEKEVEEP
jgi:NADH-quinone oxidoreductase subunit J